MSETYTVKQVAEILGYSTNSIYAFIKEGRIKKVRVGLGRFRITQDELNRVLHLSKKPSAVNTKPIIEMKPTATVPDIHFDVTSLFDWFAGSASILVGLSLFLYNRYFSTISFSERQWIFPLQVSLILAGIGVILSDFFLKNKVSIWHKIFLIILLLVYSVFSLQKFSATDWGGGIFYAGMALALLVHLFKLIKGFETFLLMITLDLLTVALIVFFKPALFPDFPPDITYYFENPLIRTFWLGFIILSVLSMWLGHLRKRTLFWITTLVYGLIYLAFSFWFAAALAWAKAFFVLMTGLTCFLIPAWESLYLFKPQHKKLILMLFGFVVCLLGLEIGVLTLMQSNMQDYAKIQLTSKSEYGRIFVESTLENIEKTVKSTGLSPALRQEVAKKNKEVVAGFLKLVFEGNQEIKRLAVLDTEGNLIAVYPYAVLTTQNFVFRDYFSQVKKTGKTYISDTFESRLQKPALTVAISGPILDEENKMVGVLAAYVNINWLENKLQEMATDKKEEYFTLLDKGYKRIMTPFPEVLGKKVEKNSLVYQLSGQKNIIGEGLSFEGKHMLKAVQQIPKTDWYLEVQTPMVKVLEPTRSISQGFFLAAVISILAGGIFLVINKIG